MHYPAMAGSMAALSKIGEGRTPQALQEVKFVLGTNVLLSGLMLPDGAPGRVVAAWREARFDLVISVHQLAEIGRTLAYPKIRRILDWDGQRIEQFIRQLYIRAQIVDLDGIAVEVPADADDV